MSREEERIGILAPAYPIANSYKIEIDKAGGTDEYMKRLILALNGLRLDAIRNNVFFESTTEFEISNRLLSINELCSYLGIGHNKGYDLVKSGKIPQVKIGNKIYVDKIDVEHFIEEHKEECINE